jgi:hypothetical protein
MLEDAMTFGAWRAIRDARMRDDAWLLAHAAARRVAPSALGAARIPADRHDDLIQEAGVLVLHEPLASVCDDTPLPALMAGVLRRLARRDRVQSRRALGRSAAPEELDARPWRSHERDGDEPRADVLPGVTAAERAAGEAIVEAGGVSAAARALGISRGALRARLQKARSRSPASPPPQSSDRSWAFRGACLADSLGDDSAATLLRDYANGGRFAELSTRFGRSAGALRHSVFTWHTKLRTQEGAP